VLQRQFWQVKRRDDMPGAERGPLDGGPAGGASDRLICQRSPYSPMICAKRGSSMPTAYMYPSAPVSPRMQSLSGR
jgi:hypothetical protein